MKKISMVPTLLTLGNAICGFAAIACASKIGRVPSGVYDPYFAAAGWLILAGMVFDALDGYAARLTRTASKFGAELDSLCDAITFGVAPAFLLFRMGPGWQPQPLLHQVLACIATLYLVCAILRLARFNVDTTTDAASHKRFRGLPSPAAAGCLASLAILRGDLPFKLLVYFPDLNFDTALQIVTHSVEIVATLGAVLVALLMVSRVPFPHVANKLLRGKKHLGHLIQFLLVAFIVVLLREIAVFAVFWIYALAFPIRWAILQQLRRKKSAAAQLDDQLSH